MHDLVPWSTCFDQNTSKPDLQGASPLRGTTEGMEKVHLQGGDLPLNTKCLVSEGKPAFSSLQCQRLQPSCRLSHHGTEPLQTPCLDVSGNFLLQPKWFRHTPDFCLQLDTWLAQHGGLLLYPTHHTCTLFVKAKQRSLNNPITLSKKPHCRKIIDSFLSRVHTRGLVVPCLLQNNHLVQSSTPMFLLC